VFRELLRAFLLELGDRLLDPFPLEREQLAGALRIHERRISLTRAAHRLERR